MSKKVILVADDIEDVRQAIMRTLGEDNFTFLEASSGEAAIDIVNKEKVSLELVLNCLIRFFLLKEDIFPSIHEDQNLFIPFDFK